MSELESDQTPDDGPWAKTSSGNADSITEDDDSENEQDD